MQKKNNTSKIDEVKDQSVFIRAQFWASQFTTIAVQIALFIGLGYLGDKYWGTAPILILCGAALSMFVATYYLWKLVTDDKFRN